MGIIAYCRCKNTTAGVLPLHIHQLRLTVEYVPDLFPIHQIFTVKYGYTREIDESGCYQKVIFSVGADTWIGIPARQNGVEKMTSSGSLFLK